MYLTENEYLCIVKVKQNMDIKDINIRNLQSEIIRLRNLLADRDAYVRSVEQDRGGMDKGSSCRLYIS